MRSAARGLLTVAIGAFVIVPATSVPAATAPLERLAPGFSTYPASAFENSAAGNVTAAATVVDVQVPASPAPDSSTSGCDAGDFALFPVGHIAVIQRGGCTFAVKAQNAQLAGASAVVIFNEGQPGRTEVVEGSLAPSVATIPVVGTSFAAGAELYSLRFSGLILRVVVTSSAGAATCASPPASGTPLAGKTVVVAQPGVVTVGTEGPDVIYGTAGPDRIAGVGGDDIIFGLGGADQLSGGEGADTLCGGADADALVGGPGGDFLSGDAGNDDMSGGTGDDELVGGVGTNRLAGGDGTDSCSPFGEAASQAAACEVVRASI